MTKAQNKPAITPTVTAIILAGGAGSRVGGADKGLLMYRNRPLIEWVVSALGPQVEALVISANRNKKAYQQLGFKVVADSAAGAQFQGPLAGITTILKNPAVASDHDFLICPCDTPLIPHDYVGKLYAALSSMDASVAVVHDGERRQNLHCLISACQIPSLLEYFTQGNRSMHGWLEEVGAVDVDFSDQRAAFVNFNSTSELS